MNNKIKSAVAAALVAGSFAIAAPASADQYLNAQLAISDIGSYNSLSGTYGFDNGVTLVGTYGLTIPAVHKFFGIEAEITKSIVNPEANGASWWWGGTHAEYDYYTAAGYAVFTIPVHEKIDVRARAGLAYNHWEITTNDTGCGFWTGFTYIPLNCSYSGSDINPSAGAGAVFKFSDNLNFMAELTAIDPDQGNFHLSAGAQFKF